MVKYNISIKYNPNEPNCFQVKRINDNTLEIFFGSKDKNIEKIYKKSLEYIPKFLEPLFDSLEGKKIKYRYKKFDFLKLIENLEFHKLISDTTNKATRDWILNEVKTLEENKATLFLYDLRNLSKIYSKTMLLPFSLAERFDAIKKGLLNKKLINNILYYSCYSTYIGFLNSFRENKIYTAKVKINNEYRRVFIKTPVHNGLGANPMFLDPKNGKVYAFSTDNKGNIKKFILRIDPKKGHIYNNIEKPIPLMSVEKLALKKLESEIENYVKKTLENQKRHRSEIIKKRNTKKVIKRVTLRK